MKKIIWIIVVVVLVGGFVWVRGRYSNAPQVTGPIKIGAIIPLSGPTAVYGEQLRNSMEMAKTDYAGKGTNVEIIYEDSQGLAPIGASAYRNLVDVQKVDIVVSAFSRVTIPLLSLATQDKIPLIMTLVSATDATSRSPYAFRLYNTAVQYVEPFFDTVLNEKNYKTLAVLYLNDEFGVSVRDVIKEKAPKSGLSIVAEESFIPNTNDFRTQLTNIKSKNPDALIFVSIAPAEATGIVKQIREMQLKANIFDGANILSNEAVRKDLGVLAEKVYISTFPFILGQSGADFVKSYTEKFNQKPAFAAPFGYDIVRFVVEATDGRKLSGDDFVSKAIGLGELNSFNGNLDVGKDREINPTLQAVQVVNGQLVPVKQHEKSLHFTYRPRRHYWDSTLEN